MIVRPALVVAGLLAIFHSLAAAEPEKLDQPLNKALSLAQYGGLNKELIIQEVNAEEIRYLIIDYDRMISRRMNDGTIQQVPQQQEFKKAKDKPDEGGQMDGYYLLYSEEKSGLKIYLHNTLATPMGTVRLRITPGNSGNKVYPG
ncbi:hypothetical protein AYO41_00260 [Verrucomicrobia bacterium SCGC AG-212-E04]|nr:hypothetical protein AYO41_00260 [Verrucomicrobia bacterium SCGC AG-212-E04]